MMDIWWFTKDVLDDFVPRKSLVVEWLNLIPGYILFAFSGVAKDPRTEKPNNPPKMCFLSITRWWSQILFNFHPYLGKWSNLTNTSQTGWIHQLDNAANSFPTTNHLGNRCLMSGKNVEKNPAPWIFAGPPPQKKIIRKRRWKGATVKAFFLSTM